MDKQNQNQNESNNNSKDDIIKTLPPSVSEEAGPVAAETIQIDASIEAAVLRKLDFR